MIKKAERRVITDKNLIMAGIKVFAECGYEKAKLSDIANIAGVSIGLIGQNFGNKLGLFKAILQNMFNTLDDTYNSAKSGTWEDCFRVLIKFIKEYCTDERKKVFIQFVKTMQNSMDTPQEYTDLAKEKFDKSMICKLMSEGQKNGELIDGDVRVLYMIMFRNIVNILYMCIDNNIPIPGDDYLIGIFKK